MMRRLFTVVAVLAAPVLAQQPTWYVLSREDGCIDLKVLARGERLSRAPVSPQDFARMMRERGEAVRIGPPADFPPELAGKVVQVTVGNSKAPVFVRDDVCRSIGR